MRKLLAGSLAAAVLTFSVAGAPVLAADASIDQVYQALRSGHIGEAQRMMDQVLRDHPDSAKAHYVEAEVSARAGDFSRSRSELARAEQIAPGLPQESAESVRELKSELAQGQPGRPFGAVPGPSSTFHWGWVVVGALVLLFFWMIFRRRTYVQYPSGPAPMGPAYGPGGYGPGGGYVGPGGGVIGGGGIGSNIAGGLAGGLAAGAGIVAGEELAHHFLDGDRRAVPPPADDWNANPANGDMGGNDFGVNDPGSWDDGSSGGGDGGGGGGDDWT
jgi:uncharacterized protein